MGKGVYGRYYSTGNQGSADFRASFGEVFVKVFLKKRNDFFVFVLA
jgi:hypothetical protein